MPNKITKLTLGEISEVTKPAQADALAAIMKAEDGARAVAIAKAYIGEHDRGAKSFLECFESAAKERAYWRAQEEIYPALNAFDSAVRTIAGDASLSIDEKQSRASESAMDFLNTLRELLPEVQDELIEAVEKASEAAGDHHVRTEVTMSDNTQEVAKLQAELDELRKSLEVAEASRADAEVIAKMSDAEKAYMDGLDDEKRKAFKAMSAQERADAMKVAKAADEVIELNGKEIRKSQAGDMFDVLKAQAEEIANVRKAQADAEARAEMVELRKRADDEFANCGNSDAVASLLKAAGSLSDDDRATLESVMKVANESAIFTAQGVNNGSVRKSGAVALDDQVKKIMTDHGVSKAKAMEIVASESPKLIEEAR